MSIYLRDPLVRELLMGDYERERSARSQLQPYLLRQPIRIQRVLQDDWPVASSFDHALTHLQNMMENVNEAIGNYQSSALTDVASGGMKTTRTEDGGLQVALDVSQFKPEEVNVKLCDDNLVVEAKTETSEKDSYHKAEFKRWIKLPKDTKYDNIKSTLTADNKLVIDVPVTQPISDSRSRQIPISVQPKPAVEEAAKSGDKKSGDQPAASTTQAKK